MRITAGAPTKLAEGGVSPVAEESSPMPQALDRELGVMRREGEAATSKEGMRALGVGNAWKWND